MAIPKEKHRPTQLTVAVIVGIAFGVPFWGLWYLVVSETAAIWLAVPSSIVLTVAVYWWYGCMQDSMQDQPPEAPN